MSEERYSGASKVSGVRASSFSRMTGIAKGTGKPYDMAKLEYLVPARDFSKEGFCRVARGYEFKQADVMLDDSLIDDFMKLVFLQPCDIYLAPDPSDMTKNFIVGVEQHLEEVVVKPVGQSQPAPSPASTQAAVEPEKKRGLGL